MYISSNDYMLPTTFYKNLNNQLKKAAAVDTSKLSEKTWHSWRRLAETTTDWDPSPVCRAHLCKGLAFFFVCGWQVVNANMSKMMKTYLNVLLKRNIVKNECASKNVGAMHGKDIWNDLLSLKHLMENSGRKPSIILDEPSSVAREILTWAYDA